MALGFAARNASCCGISISFFCRSGSKPISFICDVTVGPSLRLVKDGKWRLVMRGSKVALDGWWRFMIKLALWPQVCRDKQNLGLSMMVPPCDGAHNHPPKMNHFQYGNQQQLGVCQFWIYDICWYIHLVLVKLTKAPNRMISPLIIFAVLVMPELKPRRLFKRDTMHGIRLWKRDLKKDTTCSSVNSP